MAVLLIAEHDNKNLKPFTLNAITAASKIDNDVHILVAGTSCDGVSKEAASVPLVKKVLVCDSPNYQNYFCLLYTSPSPRDRTRSRMPSSA